MCKTTVIKMMPFLSALVDIATFIDGPKKKSRYLHKKSPFKAYTFFNYSFRLLIAQAVLIIIPNVESRQKYKLWHRFIFVGFSFKKSTQPLSVPSTSILQLIAVIIKHICLIKFHDINQNILVIVSVPSYKNPFSTDRQYYAYKVPVVTKISN